MAGRGRGDPNLLRHSVQYLRALGDQAPTLEARRQVEHALASKWEGVRRVAAQVLGRWGDPPAVATLQVQMEGDTPAGNRNAAAWALRGCVTEGDAAWALAHYFGATDPFEVDDYSMVVMALPPDAVRPAVLEAGGRPDRESGRRALKVILNVPFPDRPALLEHLAQHAHPRVRAAAQWYADYYAGRATGARVPLA